MSTEIGSFSSLKARKDFVLFDVFTGHINVLLIMAEQPQIQMDELAKRLGYHRRRIQMMVGELKNVGAIEVNKIKGPGTGRGGRGGRNSYRLNLGFEIKTAVGRSISLEGVLKAVYPELNEDISST